MNFLISNPKIYFRCDFGDIIGRGHLSRCLNLANIFKQKGFDPTFIIRKRPSIAGEELPFKTIWLKEASDVMSVNVDTWLVNSLEEEALEVVEVLRPNSIVIVDHYSLGNHFQKTLQSEGHKIVLFQDVFSTEFSADLVINYNIGTEKNYQKNFKHPATKYLVGPSYAPLGPIYSKEHLIRLKPDTKIECVGIYLGGVEKKHLEKVASALVEINFLQDKTVEWIVNSEDEKKSLDEICKNTNFLIRVRIPNMFDLYKKVQLFVGSCGLSFLERACLGLWQLNFLVADNQTEIASHVVKESLCGYLGDIRNIDKKEIINNFEKIFQISRASHIAQVSNAFVLTDGRGAERVFLQCMQE
jgi:spore coat polysaccharide biosynthesis predicted glycosyltransferase SpsG